MKKWKAVGFASLYFAISFVMQFVIAIIISVQVIEFGWLNSDRRVNMPQIEDKFAGNQYGIILVGLINLIFIVGFGLWYYFIRTRRDVSPVPYGKIRSAKSLGLTFGLAVCGQFLCSIFMTVFALIFPEIFEEYAELAETLDISVLPAWAMLFIVAVWSPLAEELIYRAMIFRTLRKGFSFWPAAIASGVLFGVYHMNIVQGLYAGLLGVLLAYTYEKTNSLLGCYLLHFMFNLSSYGIEAFTGAEFIPEIVRGGFVLVLELGALVGITFVIRAYSRLYSARKPVPTVTAARVGTSVSTAAHWSDVPAGQSAGSAQEHEGRRLRPLERQEANERMLWTYQPEETNRDE